MRLPWLLALAVLAVIAAACGGGGGGSAVAPGTSGGGGGTGTTATAGPTAAASTTAGNRSVALSIVIPKSTTSSSKSRTPQYIPSNTQSMTLTLLSVNGVAQTGSTTQGPFNLTAPTPTNPNPNCTTVTSGVKCTFSITAPVGNDIFTANTFSGANAVGPLGSGAIALSVTTNASNTASLTLDGPVASVSLFSATGGNLSNGNPIPQPTIDEDALVRVPGQRHAMLSKPQAAALHVAHTSLRTSRTSTGGVRFPAQSTPSPTPTSAVQTSSRLFVIALDAAGNQIINPTTFDIPITLTLALNGTPASLISLSVAYAGLSSSDSGSASTSADGGTVTIYSPTDQITLALGSGTSTTMTPYAPSVSASYTPQGGTPQVTSPLAFTVNANPPGPYYALTNSHSSSLVVSAPGNLFTTVANTGTGATSATLEVYGEIDNAAINSFTSTGTANFWSCNVTYSDGYYADYDCTGNGPIAAGASQPIEINVTPYSTDDVYHYTSFYTDAGLIATGYDDIPVAGVATPTPPPTPSLSVNAYAAPAPSPTIFTNDLTQYSVQVSNNGTVATSGTITLVDTLPSGFTYESFSGTNWACVPATGPSAGPITCTDSVSIGASSSAPTLTLVESAGNTTAFTTVTNAFSLSGGNSASTSASVTSSVLPALQFISASFNPSATFTAAVPSNPSATVDFGLLTSGATGSVVLQSFYTATGSNYVTPTIESESDGCYPSVTASPNPVPSFVPITMPYTANINVGGSGAVGPCTVTITDANGSSASLTIQSESTSISVNAKGRKK